MHFDYKNLPLATNFKILVGPCKVERMISKKVSACLVRRSHIKTNGPGVKFRLVIKPALIDDIRYVRSQYFYYKWLSIWDDNILFLRA